MPLLYQEPRYVFTVGKLLIIILFKILAIIKCRDKTYLLALRDGLANLHRDAFHKPWHRGYNRSAQIWDVFLRHVLPVRRHELIQDLYLKLKVKVVIVENVLKVLN